jgi:integral membrane protein
MPIKSILILNFALKLIKITDVKGFKFTAILEGISYLVLIANMLILKSNNPELYHHSETLGMSHGFLFIAYIVSFFTKKKAQGWSWPTLGIILAAFNPFWDFLYRKKYCKHV